MKAPRIWLVVAVVAMMSVTGCGAQGAATAPPESIQVGICDGVAEPAGPVLLDPQASVSAVVVCRTMTQYFPDQGLWTVASVAVLPTGSIPELVRELTGPDVAADPNRMCAGVGHEPEPFVLTLADGSRVRPRLPSDGCQPKWDVLKVFDAAVVRSTEKVAQVATQVEVTTGCGSEAKGPTIWLGANSAGTAGAGWALPNAANAEKFGICHYQGTRDGEGVLNGHAKLISANDLRKMWPTASSTPPPQCPPAAGTLPAVDWLQVNQAPRPPYDGSDLGSSQVVLVELGGCRRVVAATNRPLIGYLTEQQVAALKALV